MSIACAPADDTDIAVKACESWCDAEYANDHCLLCKCSACSFCETSSEADENLAGPPSAPVELALTATDELALSATYTAAYESAFKAAMLEVQRAEEARLAREQAEAEQACEGAYSLARCWRAHGLDILPPPPPPLPPSPPPELPARETARPRAAAAAKKAAREAERARQREEIEQAQRLAREDAAADAELTELGITLLPPPASPPARSGARTVAAGDGSMTTHPALQAGVRDEIGAGDDASGGAMRSALMAVGAVAFVLVVAEARRCRARRHEKNSSGVSGGRRKPRRTQRIPQEEEHLELEAAVPAPRRQQQRRLPGRARRGGK